ncbi:MAG: arsenate reductase ArsC [Bacteroidia bacterium]|nr:arsenate reductase ArsC [Bacteroidia bacterium]
MVRILVVCTHNSARSQMAEAFLRRLLGQKAEVHSAGTHPTRVHPLAQAVMHEIGYGLSSHTSDPIDKYLSQTWDYVITVCDSARETCPYVPAKHHLHVSFPDPSQGDTETFRTVRDAIHTWAKQFSQALHEAFT